ncbi:hypothetical protein K9L27_00080 [Candidatus Gracilibacteria bacterium]|nr:hypothetical protein [Candidatus Gracilibacteria bacterium]
MKTALILVLSFVLMACTQVTDDEVMTDETMPVETETMMPPVPVEVPAVEVETPAVEVETPVMEVEMNNEGMMEEENIPMEDPSMMEEGAPMETPAE